MDSYIYFFFDIYTWWYLKYLKTHIPIKITEPWYATISLIDASHRFRFPFSILSCCIKLYVISILSITQLSSFFNKTIYSGWEVSWIIHYRLFQILRVKACLSACGLFLLHLKVKACWHCVYYNSGLRTKICIMIHILKIHIIKLEYACRFFFIDINP